QRALIARLSQGAAGRALSFDLDAYTAARADAMIFLRNAAAGVQDSSGARGPAEPDHTALFKMTETYRAGADGHQKTTALLRALHCGHRTDDHLHSTLVQESEAEIKQPGEDLCAVPRPPAERSQRSAGLPAIRQHHADLSRRVLSDFIQQLPLIGNEHQPRR